MSLTLSYTAIPKSESDPTAHFELQIDDDDNVKIMAAEDAFANVYVRKIAKKTAPATLLACGLQELQIAAVGNYSAVGISKVKPGSWAEEQGVMDNDFLIAVGARFDDRVAGVPHKFAPNVRHIAQFDIDPSEIDKVKPVDWSHVGVLKQDLKAIYDHGVQHRIKTQFGGWHEEIAELKKPHALNYDRESDLIQPYAVIEAINEITKGDAIISTAQHDRHVGAARFIFVRLLAPAPTRRRGRSVPPRRSSRRRRACRAARSHRRP